jgi:hypothetical protein
MYRACGKEVLRDREHFADAVSEQAATTIADALNYWETLSAPIDDETYPLPFSGEEIDVTGLNFSVPNVTGTHHNVRQENDEFACSCGKRWDTSEGSEHP